jgi:hypothetical protein
LTRTKLSLPLLTAFVQVTDKRATVVGSWHFSDILKQPDDVRSPGQADIPPQGQRTSEAFTSNYLNRRLSRDNWSIDEQPISFIPRSISVRIRPSARSTPAWPTAAS